jgi:hypothetical protein
MTQAIAMATNHVTIGDDNVPRIDGSRFKVIHLATAVRSGIETPRARYLPL